MINSAVLRGFKRDVSEFDSWGFDSFRAIEFQVSHHEFSMLGIRLVDQALRSQGHNTIQDPHSIKLRVLANASADLEFERLGELLLVPVEICL